MLLDLKQHTAMQIKYSVQIRAHISRLHVFGYKEILFEVKLGFYIERRRSTKLTFMRRRSGDQPDFLLHSVTSISHTDVSTDIILRTMTAIVII